MKFAKLIPVFLLLNILVFAIYFTNTNDPRSITPTQTTVTTTSQILSTEDLDLTAASTASTSTQSLNKQYKVLFVGDIMTSRSIGEAIRQGVNPLSSMQTYLAKYDLIIGNLETNISTAQSPVNGKLYTFNAPLETIDFLKTNHINIVSLANNHTMDFGQSGFLNMISNLENKDVKYFGAGRNISEAYKPLIVPLGTTTIALIGINDIENWYTNASETTPGSAPLKSEMTIQAIKTAKANADVAIVIPHWGYEYYLDYSKDQQDYAYQYIDAGADIIIGGHPHVRQGTEDYKSKRIYYSMGNFVFDEMPQSDNSGFGYMVEVIIENHKIISSRPINIKLNEQGFPELDL